ncbi:MAG TPA: hypothetical protein PLH60_01525 [Proteiniphilum sp.]|nr:hypothetical protein JS578_00410 [Dysgonomonadaceae bacterium zrk40]HOO94512.1 hypothetical protein [Proteiniphilum sp.]HPJ49707.1 hypothetical protein [Proteiniphilum sp.]HPR19221.1 hypothetical protein [Proteiniphilum sp.]
MKTRFFLMLLFVAGSVSLARAQYVNETPIGSLDADYIRIWSDSGPLLSSKVTVRVDWGQGGRIPQITDDRRRVVSFNGMIAVLNMLSKEGFELMEIVRDAKEENEFFYLRRKEGFVPFSGDSEGGAVEYDPVTHSR